MMFNPKTAFIVVMFVLTHIIYEEDDLQNNITEWSWLRLFELISDLQFSCHL